MALPRFVNKLTWSVIVLSAVWFVVVVVFAFHAKTLPDTLGIVVIMGWPLPLAVFARWIIT